MVGHLVRRGGSVLAALAVVVGGAAMGTGVAGGAAGGGFGSTGVPCVGLTSPLCDGIFSDGATAGNIGLSYWGPAEAEVDSEVAFTSRFLARDAMPDLAVTSVTHHAPRGFEFVGAEVQSRRGAVYPDPDTYTELDATVVVDPVTGDVTVAAPAGGWAIPRSQESSGSWRTGQVDVKLRYQVTKSHLDGTSGVTFTGTGVPASEGWLATGATRVTPGIGGFNSSGN